MSVPVAAPRMLVDSPPAAGPHRFGLFVAAALLENVEPHALLGVEYEAVTSAAVAPWPASCEPTVPDGLPDGQKLAQQTTSTVTGTPFAVYAADRCVLGRDPLVARRQLRQRFTAGEETAVEQVVFTGLLGNQPNLAAADVVAGGAALELVDAVGQLEQWLADTGCVGVLHAPLWSAPRLREQRQVFVAGPTASTLLGSTWVFGAGYPATPPTSVTDPDDGALWLYATGQVTVRRGPIIEPGEWASGAFDRSQNLGSLLSERLYVADWAGGTAAAKTTLTRPGFVAALNQTPITADVAGRGAPPGHIGATDPAEEI
jgi:hypothetical protein